MVTKWFVIIGLLIAFTFFAFAGGFLLSQTYLAKEATAAMVVPTPPAPVLPDVQATVEVAVQATVSAVLNPSPTPVPLPTPRSVASPESSQELQALGVPQYLDLVTLVYAGSTSAEGLEDMRQWVHAASQAAAEYTTDRAYQTAAEGVAHRRQTIEETIGVLVRVQPPGGLESLHQNLIGVVEQFQDGLSRAEAAVASHDDELMVQAVAELDAILAQYQEIQQRMAQVSSALSEQPTPTPRS